ncbi:hypothetical protein J4229_02800 [Candidatus Pacearchaeota archaeon]|nr:hypothetical protein [Candidatus Pacearchaeota archaeon]
MRELNKRGLSPVIASVLLVALVVVLAAIIYLWARAFIPESIEKFGGIIEDSCKNAVFEASYYNGELVIQNNGNVPFYGIRAGVEKSGSLKYEDFTGPPIVAATSKSFKISASSGENIRIIPILLGKTTRGELKAFACDDDSMKIIQA